MATFGSPFLAQTSRWFRAQAFTLTSASSELGLGSGASSYCSTSGPPCLWNLTAFIGPRTLSSSF